MVTNTSTTRIDFSGGTLDIFPLYLLHQGVTVVNASISIATSVTVTPSKNDSWKIKSKDKQTSWTFKNWNSIPPSDFEMIYLAMYYFQKYSGQPCEVTTNSEAPLGSGLGASSSMLIGFVSSMIQFLKLEWNFQRIIRVANGIETAHLQVPTGLQDYVPALYGGINSIRFSIDGMEIRPLDLSKTFQDTLSKSSILAFSGVSHSSGKENWEIFKRRVDGDHKIIKVLNDLKEISEMMEGAMINGDFETFKSLLNQEWEHRKKLHPTIETPEIRQIATKLGDYDLSMKVCGAGGGGTVLLICERNERTDIETILKQDQIQILDFEYTKTGTTMKDSTIS